MKKAVYVLIALLLPSFLVVACNDGETYADQKKRERGIINNYIADNKINVITMAEFRAQDSTTDVSRNEYVLFDDNGVYMQIVRKGEGTRIGDGETRKILCRFVEYDMEGQDTTLTNIYTSSIVDAMMVSNTSGTYTAYFTDGMMLNYMQSYYSSGSSAVPSAWLMPLPYIRLTRNTSEIAKIRLIVPHSEGTLAASSTVTPYYYEITYQLGR